MGHKNAYQTEEKNGGTQWELQQRVKKYKNQSELKNMVAEMKNTLDGINSRLDDTEKCISNLEDRIVVFTQTEKQKEILKNEDSLRDFWDNIILTFTL